VGKVKDRTAKRSSRKKNTTKTRMWVFKKRNLLFEGGSAGKGRILRSKNKNVVQKSEIGARNWSKGRKGTGFKREC